MKTRDRLFWVIAGCLLFSGCSPATLNVTRDTTGRVSPTESLTVTQMHVTEDMVSEAVPSTISVASTATLSPLPHCEGGYIVFRIGSDPDRKEDGAYLLCPSAPQISRQILPDPEFGFLALDMARDGTRVLFAPYGEEYNYLASVNVLDFSITTLLRPEAKKLMDEARWLPDMEYVAYLNAANAYSYTVEVVHVDTHIVSTVITHEHITDFELSPDGKHILYTTSEGRSGPSDSDPVTQVADLTCDSLSRDCITSNVHVVTNLGRNRSWSSDSSIIISLIEKGETVLIRMVDLSGNIMREININVFDPPLENLGKAVQSPDGNYLAFVAENTLSGYENIYMLDLDTMQLTPLTQSVNENVFYGLLDW